MEELPPLTFYVEINVKRYRFAAPPPPPRNRILKILAKRFLFCLLKISDNLSHHSKAMLHIRVIKVINDPHSKLDGIVL